MSFRGIVLDRGAICSRALCWTPLMAGITTERRWVADEPRTSSSKRFVSAGPNSPSASSRSSAPATKCCTSWLEEPGAGFSRGRSEPLLPWPLRRPIIRTPAEAVRRTKRVALRRPTPKSEGRERPLSDRLLRRALPAAQGKVLDGSACRAPHARHRRARSGLRNAGHNESVALIERHSPRVRRF